MSRPHADDEPSTSTTTLTTSSKPPPTPPEAKQIVLDSLPYIDQIQPEYEDYALSLIQHEMDQNPLNPSKEEAYLNHLPNVATTPSFSSSSSSSLNKFEYHELQKRNGAPRDTAKSFNLPSISPPSSEKENDETEWKKCIASTKITLEHYRHTLSHLELSILYDSLLWRHYNSHTLQSLHATSLEKKVMMQRQKVDDVNSKRKRMQEEETGVKLRRLEGQWADRVGRMERLRNAEGKLMGEVGRLRGVLEELVEGKEKGGKE